MGIGLALVVYLLLGNAELSRARVVAAVATLMAVWWMTEAMPLSVTSLLPIILFPLLTDRTSAAPQRRRLSRGPAGGKQYAGEPVVGWIRAP